MKTAWRPLAAAAPTSLALAAGAGDTLYKSVDSTGNVRAAEDDTDDDATVIYT